MTAEYEQELADLDTLEKGRFQRFHEYRAEKGLWNLLVERELSEAIPVTLAMRQDGIDFQSPQPMRDIQDHVNILCRSPIEFEYRVPGQQKRSRDLERDHLLSKRAWWVRDINPMERWRRRVSEGLTRHGVKVEQLCARKCPPLPGYDDMEDEDEGEEYRSDKSPNYFKNVLLDGCFWTNDNAEDPGSADCFYYKYSVPVYGSDLKGKHGRLSLDRNDNLVHLGDDERHDKETTGKKFTVIVKDARDFIGICPLKGCDHPMRKITCYVCPPDKGLDAGEQIASYQSPFEGNSFFVIGGLMNQTERDPDRVYRPLMEPVYVLQAWLNMLITWHTVLAFQEADDTGLYGNASQAKPENVAATLTGEDGPKTSIKLPEPGVDEIPVYGFSIDRMPKKSSQEVMQLIVRCTEMMQEFRPNRALTGFNFTEQSNATVGMGIAAMQQAGAIYNPLLMEVAGAINRWDRETNHQIRWYAYMEPDDTTTKWYATPNVDDIYSSKASKGEQVYLDAKKCSVEPDLVVTIQNMTYAEQQADWYLALSKYQSGVMTVAQLIRKSGVFDVEGQQRMLRGDQIRQTLTPMLLRAQGLLMAKIASIETGYDYTSLLQEVTPQQEAVQPPGVAGPNTHAANAARSTQMPANPVTNPAGGAGGII